MAYSFQTALVVAKGSNQRWVELDVGSMTITALLNTYRGLLLTLTNPFVSGSVTFDLSANRSLVNNFSLTVDQWLVENGSTTLPTIPGSYSASYKKARYKDAVQAGYYIKRVHPTAHPDMVYPDSDLRDLLVTKTDADYDFLQRHSLVNVNGFYHRTEATLNGMYIRHGGKSGLIANDTHVGLLSTVNLGEVTYVGITESMIYKQAENHNLATRAFINVGQDLDNKTILLSLGGYLHVLDGLYRNIGNGQVVLHLDKIRFLQRYLESREFIDLSSIKDLFPQDDQYGIPVGVFKSEECIKRFLTLPQSFFVIIDTPSVITKRKDLDMTGLHGVAIAYSRPEDLLFLRSGSGASYFTKEENGQWVITYKPRFEHFYRFEGSDWEDSPSIDDAEELEKIGILGKGYLLEIGKETLTL